MRNFTDKERRKRVPKTGEIGVSSKNIFISNFDLSGRPRCFE